jgi:hypothetical protein
MSSQPNPDAVELPPVSAEERAEGQDEYTAVFANGRGFLTYRVPAGGELVVLLRLVWVE